MNRSAHSLILLIVLVVLGMSTAGAEAQSEQDTAAVQQVIQRMDMLREAQIRNNAATLKRIYADEYTLTEGDGTVFTKSQRIAALGELKFDSNTLEDITVRTYGNTAVLTSRATVRFREEPVGPFSVRVTIVFVRRDGRWQIVASHESCVDKPRTPEQPSDYQIRGPVPPRPNPSMERSARPEPRG